MLPSVQGFHSSLQKLEWNYKDGERDVWKHLVQVRASGLRIKRPDFSPALVAASDSQIPIVAWKRRYLTVRECARLQSMDDISLPNSIYDAYEALGNAVNVKLVSLILEKLVGGGEEEIEFLDGDSISSKHSLKASAMLERISVAGL